MKTIFPPKSISYLLMSLLFSSTVISQVGINTTEPALGAMLDINSTDKGLLIPRVNIENLSSVDPVSEGATEGLMVFNINSTTGKGFYYWNGTNWRALYQTDKTTGWDLAGNVLTNELYNFIGTIDDNDLVFRTNNEEAMRLTSPDGQLLIGTSTPGNPNNLLQVSSDIEIGGAASNYNYVSENIQINAQSEEWKINVKNDIDADDSNFYIGTSESPNDAGLMITTDGKVKIGKSGDVKPLSDLHICKDQVNKATTLRLDNTVSSTNIPHTSYELWDGNTFLKGFFRHNNYSNVLDIGHNQGNGTFNFYAGNGNSSSMPSSIAMTLDSNGDLNVVNDLNVAGNIHVTGNISKGGGTFKIDHPLDPANKYLFHSFVESPDMMNIYNGNVITNEKGEAIVTMPDYFTALNIDFRYQLTTIGSFSKVMIAEEMTHGTFRIKSEDPNVKISWQVTGVRNDAYARKNRVKVEVEKEEHAKGTYLYPEAYKTEINN